MNINNLLGTRKQTQPVDIGDLTIGDNNPVRVQSMTNVFTRDIDNCVTQINKLTKCGCEIIRVSVPTPADTAALAEIINQIDVPLVADVHFHYARALEAIDAGVDKIRLNPGNIKDRRQVTEVINACKTNNTAIRVGVNEGSVKELKDPQLKNHESQMNLPDLMIDKLRNYVNIFEDNNFDRLVLSAKCHDAGGTIAVNRLIAENFNYPLHLGVTHAGAVQIGAVRSAAAVGTLLAEGIGDAVRISLAGNPVEEVKVAWEILNSLGLRPRTRPELIACPTCGRTEIDLLDMVEKVNLALQDIHYPVTVAVMGCVVNGPGEAEVADVALCGGRDKAVIYSQGLKAATVAAENAVPALLEQINIFIANNRAAR